jgi:hypothetical protein
MNDTELTLMPMDGTFVPVLMHSTQPTHLGHVLVITHLVGSNELETTLYDAHGQVTAYHQHSSDPLYRVVAFWQTSGAWKIGLPHWSPAAADDLPQETDEPDTPQECAQADAADRTRGQRPARTQEQP